MPQHTTLNSPSQTPIHLAKALKKSESVEERVKQSASEMLVINAVLQQEIPAHVQSGEVAQALSQSDEIEDRLHASARELSEINRVLELEINEREQLERELARTKAKLAQTEDALRSS